LQFHDAGVAEGQIILQGDVGAGGGRGFLFQSTQTTMAGRFTGRVISPLFQDADNSACHFDGNDGNGSSTWRLGVVDMTVSGHLDANYARIGRMVTGVAGDDSTYIYSSWLSTKHVFPDANGSWVLGYPWDGNPRAWYDVYSYNFWQASSRTLKKEITPVSFDHQERILDAVRNAEVAFFYFNEEQKDEAQARALAQKELEKEREALVLKLKALGIEDEKINAVVGAKPSEDEINLRTQMRFRPVPHIGVIAESLPREVKIQGKEDAIGYSLADMDGFLLAAIKALEAENRDLRQRVEFLEKVLADKGFFDDL
jgi:hypothetical protein